MPKWPRSSGPPRKVFGTCIVYPLAKRRCTTETRRARRKKVILPPCPPCLRGELKRASGGEEGENLVRILHSGTALDAGGNIDRRRTGNTDRLGQHLCGQTAGQHPWAAPRPIRDQPPVESQTVAPRQSIRLARRLRVEQQQIRDIFIARGAEHVLRPSNRNRLHYRQAKSGPNLANALRRLAAVELQDVERRQCQRGLDHRIISIDKEAHSCDTRGNRGAEPGSFTR